VGLGRLLGFALLAASMSVAACASTDPTLAGRFVRQGKPPIDVGGPKLPKTRSVDRRALLNASQAARPPAPVLTSLESTDADLRNALARLVGAPTAAHYLDVANHYLRHGVFDRADEYLNRSLAANGPDAAIYDARARLWRDWGQPGEALGDAHRAAYMAPQSAAAHNTLGTVLYRLGRVSDAKASFTRALQADPTAWYAMANLCHVNMNAGDTKTAINQCHMASALRKRAGATK
jgi:tetratricopeptide (TPR) repeat protein